MEIRIIEEINEILKVVTEHVLEKGEPWSRYVLMRDVLQLPPDESHLVEARQAMIQDRRIKQVHNRLNDPVLGVSSLADKPVSHKIYGSFYWGLRFLADIGLTNEHLNFDEVVEQIFLYQTPDGQFTVGYRNKYSPVTTICLTAQLVYSLVQIGYRHTRGVQAAINFILTTIRKDGGWHCDVLKQAGERNEKSASCPSANLQIIRALSFVAELSKSLLENAVVQVFDFWENQEFDYQSCDFGNSNIYRKFRYPPHYWGFDILNVLDTLSLYPDYCNNSSFDEMIRYVISKWNGRSLFNSEKKIPEWSEFNFAGRNNPSCWISTLICRVLSRIYFKNMNVPVKNG